MDFLPILLADAGTALMWAGAFHLFVGNLLIGAGEAARCPLARTATPRLVNRGVMCQLCGHALTEEFPLFRLARRSAPVARHSNP